MTRSRLPAAVLLLLGAAALIGSTAFLPQPGSAVGRAASLAAPAALALAASPLPALAGGPPSVGDHWYWDLGIGSLHGETASIIILVFALLVIFSLLGAGGSSRKSA
eukprot:CAMPEP_0183429724 /NCGR_PEP_ID=MMETSP0370-20130417/49063_1 /TAXON_ID=268820 /ORGANISM="Peridinium aciculiferum, Strain PAER-2" /LENGTH=106 /DNA_ID=CAMNT_0025614845 /DNA_START=76 /DNA_END=396 /DNA_ORIENTATION=-